MTRIGRDSTVARDIPLKGLAVAMGYANGAYQWSKADAARFTSAGIHVASIDVLGTEPGADILDVEPFDVWPPDRAVKWIQDRRKLPTPPAYPGILYANRSTLTPLFNALNGAGLRIVRDFRLGIATLDGTKTVPDMTGVTFVQYAGTAQTGGHYDESIIYDDAWKAPVKPPPAPAPTLVKVSATATFSDGTTKTWTVQ